MGLSNHSYQQKWKFTSQPLAVSSVDADSLPHPGDFARLLEAAGQMILVFNAHWEYTYISPAAADLAQQKPEEMIGRNVFDPFPATKTSAFFRHPMQAMSDRVALLFEAFSEIAQKWFAGQALPLDDGGLLLILQDLTRHKQYEVSLQRSEAHLQHVIDSNPNAILTLDREGHLLTINRRGLEILEATDLADVIYTFWLDNWSKEDRDTVETALQNAIRGKTSHHQGQGRTLKGAERWWDMILTPMESAGRKTDMLMAVVTDITEQRHIEAEKDLLFQEALDRADRDSLTGLWNHSAFNRLMDILIATLPTGQPYAVLILDINNFKFFNDAYGHLCGDEILTLVANTLRAGVRGDDIVARMGGDEFAIFLPGMPQSTVDTYTERLRSQMATVHFAPSDSGLSIPIDLSIGAACYPDDALTGVDLYRIADERCLRNKLGDQNSTVAALYENLRKTVPGFPMLDSLVAAVDAKDRYTRRHSEEVLIYSLMIARAMWLPDAFCNSLMKAALIHDVGKIGVPDRILRYPGQLSQEERELMQRHPQMGSILVKAAGGLDDTLEAVLHHHEAWNGSGYPHQLAGEAIPLSGRIMAVADAFSALTTNRPYRKGMSAEDAMRLLEDGSGVQWDPSCVTAFLQAMRGE